MIARLRGLLVVLGGCRFGFDFTPSSRDAHTDDVMTDAPADAMVDAPSPTGPFGTAAPVAALNSGDEDDPTLTLDQLEIYFNSTRTGTIGGNDLWTATRTSVTAAWTGIRNVSELNTTGDDATPEVSRDGLTLFFVANGPSGMKDIRVASRPDRASAWMGNTPVGALSSPFDESGPTMTADQLTIYFTHNGSTDDDIFLSTRTAIGAPWSAPMAVPFNSGTFNDQEPAINGANTFLIWSSDRDGDFDLWSVRRATPSDPWGPPQQLTELNTGGAEHDPWLSADEHTIYFSRNAALYMATR